MFIRKSSFFFLVAFSVYSFGQTESINDLLLEGQSLFRKGDYSGSLEKYKNALSLPNTDSEQLSTIRKNAALSALSAGQNDTAYSLYQTVPGPEGSYGLGISLFRQAKESEKEPATNAVLRAKTAKKTADLFGKASDSFRSAIQGGMTDPVVQTNLVTALQKSKEWVLKEKEANLEVQYGEKTPPELLKLLMTEQKKSYVDGIIGVTNTVSFKIKQFEKASEKQRVVADIWPFLEKEILAQARNQTTNEEQLAELQKQFVYSKDRADGSWSALEDLNPAAFTSMRENNMDALRVFSMISDPLQLVTESISIESNALERVVDYQKFRVPTEEQGVVKGLFSVFQQKLPDWLEQKRQQNSVSTENQQSDSVLTEEDMEELDRLIQQVNNAFETISKEIGKTDRILPDSSIPAGQQAQQDMIAIKKILEKTQPPQENQQNQQNEQDKKEKNDSKQNQENQKQNDQNQQNEQESQSLEENSSQPEKEDEKKPEEKTQQDPEEQAANEMMQAILKLEKQREEEKNKKRFVLPAKVGEKDW